MTVKTTTGVSSIGRVLPGVLDGGPNHMAKVGDGHKWRPLRYFAKFGIIQDANYK